MTLIFYMFFIFIWCHMHYFFKNLAEIHRRIISALHSCFCNIHVTAAEHFAGVVYTYIIKIVRYGNKRVLFEKLAHILFCYVNLVCYIIKSGNIRIIAVNIFKNRIYRAVVTVYFFLHYILFVFHYRHYFRYI